MLTSLAFCGREKKQSIEVCLLRTVCALRPKNIEYSDFNATEDVGRG